MQDQQQDNHICSKQRNLGHLRDANRNSAHYKCSTLNAPMPTQSNLSLERIKESQTGIRNNDALKYSMCWPTFLMPLLVRLSPRICSGPLEASLLYHFWTKAQKSRQEFSKPSLPCCDGHGGLMLSWQNKRIKAAWIAESLHGEQLPWRVAQTHRGVCMSEI